MLSGKNKDNFEEHYTSLKKVNTDRLTFVPESYYKIPLSEFYNLPPEMQKGVYEKYFDSLGYLILLEDNIPSEWYWRIKELNSKGGSITEYRGWNDTRLEAFTEAVKQLDKLINDEL